MTPISRIIYEDDVAPATWFTPLLHDFAVDTGSIIPEGFDSYCRIFHPLRPHRPDAREPNLDRTGGRKWSHPHPQMQIHRISRPAGTVSSDYDLNDYLNELDWGTLPAPERSILIDLLRDRTTTPEQCWFCVWEGFGDVDLGGHARVHLPQRDYALYGGPIEMALASLEPPRSGQDDAEEWTDARNDQSPNLWWPEDRSWFVATEIDFAWTYVGGTEETINAILDTKDLEALVVELSDKPFADSDLVNAALDSA